GGHGGDRRTSQKRSTSRPARRQAPPPSRSGFSRRAEKTPGVLSGPAAFGIKPPDGLSPPDRRYRHFVNRNRTPPREPMNQTASLRGGIAPRRLAATTGSLVALGLLCLWLTFCTAAGRAADDRPPADQEDDSPPHPPAELPSRPLQGAGRGRHPGKD